MTVHVDNSTAIEYCTRRPFLSTLLWLILRGQFTAHSREDDPGHRSTVRVWFKRIITMNSPGGSHLIALDCTLDGSFIFLVLVCICILGGESDTTKGKGIYRFGGKISGREPRRVIHRHFLPFWLANSTFYSFPCLQQTWSLVWID